MATKATRQAFKATTKLTGLNVRKNPHTHLDYYYTKIQNELNKMPKASLYRQYTEEIVKHRHNLVLNEPDIEELEKKIGERNIEEAMLQAEREYRLSRILLKEKVWEPLVEEAPPKQWTWPPT